MLWSGLRSMGDRSLRHLSHIELLTHIVIFKACSYKFCINFITKNAFNPLIQLVMRYTAFPHFCAGTNANDAKILAAKLQKNNVKTIVDHSVEELETLDAFAYNLQNKVFLIQSLKNSPASTGTSGSKEELNYIPLKPTSLISPHVLERLANILSKQNFDSNDLNLIHVDDADAVSCLNEEDKKSFDSGVANLSKLLAIASESGCSILLDAEQSNRQAAIDLIARVLMKKFNLPDKPPVVYNTYQSYLRASKTNIFRDLRHAADNNYTFALKLVRGAYMNSEMSRGTSPLYPNKAAVDANYNENAVEIIELISKVIHSSSIKKNISDNEQIISAPAPYIFIATHNTDSIDKCVSAMFRTKLVPQIPNIKFAQILGMSDHITYALALNNFNSYKLACFGDFNQVYPWLLRRLQENQDIFGAMQADRFLLSAELRRRLQI